MKYIKGTSICVNTWKLRLILLLFLWCFNPTHFSAQEISETYIDSIVALSKSMKSDAKKMEIGKLTQKMSRMQPKAALPLYHYLDTEYASEKELRMYAYLSYGPNLVNNGLIERSKEIRFQGLKWAKELNNHVMIHDFYHLISSHYVNTTVVDSATFYVNEAEKIALENLEDLGPMLWQDRKSVV